MPQMAPLWWPFLFTLFTVSFIISGVMIYFYFSNHKTRNFKTLSHPTINWKW